MSWIARLILFLGYDMPKLLKNALYILTVIAVSFVICKYVVGIEVSNDWLYGALLVPLIAVIANSWGQEKNND